MTKTVLDIGNCDPDHATIKSMISSRYDANVLRAHQQKDALELLNENDLHLILINRKLDIDYTDGVEILKFLKSDAATKDIPVMLITNYPDHQEQAVALGAEYGFGKLQYGDPETHQRLSRVLDPRTQGRS